MGRIKTILIIDDEQSARRMMAEVVKELFEAATVITFSSTFSALAYLKNHCMPTLHDPHMFCPELILLDIHMPVINGYEFISELHQIEGLRHNHTAILLISTMPYEKHKEKANQFSILGYLEKPVTIENLRYSLKNILPT